MSPFLRKVKTASGATAVQIVDKSGGGYRIVEHLGSAHSEAELAALMHAGNQRLRPGQQTLDLGLDAGGAPDPGRAVVRGSASKLLTSMIARAYAELKFDAVADEGFFQLVLARLVEPTSKLDSVRVVQDLGVAPVHLSTYKRALKRCAERDYRSRVAAACFDYSLTTSGLSLLLKGYPFRSPRTVAATDSDSHDRSSQCVHLAGPGEPDQDPGPRERIQQAGLPGVGVPGGDLNTPYAEGIRQIFDFLRLPVPATSWGGAPIFFVK